MNSRVHWESAYQRKKADELSWFQRMPTLSLELIQSVTTPTSVILDAGGGASTLVDGLLGLGYQAVTVLDLSRTALDQARERLGPNAERVTWLEGNILDADLPDASVDLWHDRAVFHFLVDPIDRERYLNQIKRVVRANGFALVATFAEDGPTRCSGLPVARYSAPELQNVFGRDFQLITSRREQHRTPAGATQSFTYCLFRRA